jgi:hypothetical protein
MATEKDDREDRAAVLAAAAGHVLARSLHVAVDLRLAERLRQGPLSSAELARLTATDETSLYRLMHFLGRHGYFEEQAGRSFALARLGRLLCADAPDNLPAVIRSLGHQGVWAAFSDFSAAIRTGEAPESGRGRSLYQRHREADDHALAEAMAGYHAGEPERVAEQGDFARASLIVDVGGSSGGLLTAILTRHPHLRGIVFDRPGLAADAEKRIQAAGARDRCRFVGGDFFAEVPAGGDTYLLSHVLHDWSDREALEILRCCRRAMPAGARLLLIEALMTPEGHNEDELPADLMLLANTEGRLRTLEEYRLLMSDAGMKLETAAGCGPTLTIIEARSAR